MEAVVQMASLGTESKQSTPTVEELQRRVDEQNLQIAAAQRSCCKRYSWIPADWSQGLVLLIGGFGVAGTIYFFVTGSNGWGGACAGVAVAAFVAYPRVQCLAKKAEAVGDVENAMSTVGSIAKSDDALVTKVVSFGQLFLDVGKNGIAAEQKRSADLEAANSETQRKYADALQQIATITESFNSAKETYRKIEVANEEMTQKISELAGDKASLSQQISELQASEQNTREQANQNHQQFTSALDTVKQENAKFQSEIAELKQQLGVLDGKIKTLEMDKTSLIAENETLTNLVAEAKKEETAAKDLLAKIEQQKAFLQQQIDTINQKLSAAGAPLTSPP